MAVSGEALPGLAPEPDSVTSFDPSLLEPAAWLSSLSPPGGLEASSPAVAASPARTLEPEVALAAERWVRRLAWGGDGRRGTARLELGAGALAGAELVVTTEAGQVLVELAVPAAAIGLSEQLRARLEARGYFTTVTVR